MQKRRAAAPTGRASGRRPAAPRRAAPSRLRDDLKQEIAGVIIAGLGAWLYISLGSGGGALGKDLAVGLLKLMGWGAWLLPGLLLFLGGYMIWRRQGFAPGLRLWGWGLLTADLLAVFGALRYPAVNDPGAMQRAVIDQYTAGGGGLVGWALLSVINPVFGPQGRWVVLIAVGSIAAALAMEFSAAQVLRFAWSGLRAVGRALAALGRGLVAFGRDLADVLRPRPRPAPPAAVPAAAPRAGKVVVLTPEPEPLLVTGKPAGKAPSGPVPPPPAAAAAAAPAPAPGPAPVIQLHDSPSRAVQVKLPVPEAPEAPPAAARTGKVLKLRRGDGGEAAAAPAPAAALPPAAGVAAAFELPPVALLAHAPKRSIADSKEDITERIVLLEQTLRTFGAEARVVAVTQGPTITRFEVQPGSGVKVAKIVNLKDDLALSLAGEVRIDLVPNRQAVGIEVPNREVASVFLRDVLDTPEFLSSPSKLTVALGKSIDGNPVLGVLERMPHLLIAGTTGSGKSVCMNAVITSLLYKARPDEVKLLMIDPKKVEMAVYEGIPHLAAPVVTEPRRAAGFLKWAVKEMENRYDLFASSGCRNITQYNKLCQDDPDDGGTREEPRQPLPYVVIFIDELADLMMVAGAEVEDAICRLAQMARAAGMHLVIATQRPSVDVITGVIKNNIPSRIAFAVASQTDSRVILDQGGAEALLGRGDMLYHFQGMSKPTRAQCAFISEKEVEAVVHFVKKQGGQPEFHAEALELEDPGPRGRRGSGNSGGDGEAEGGDGSFAKALWVCVEEGQASVSLLQRRLRVNYTKAVRLIDDMEERGYVGPRQGVKPRDVLIGRDRYLEVFGEIP